MSTKRNRLLVVEDEPRLRKAVAEYFSKREFEVDQASNGKEGILFLQGNSYDIILLDIMMPEIDGMEVCRCIRQRYDVPVIFLTALEDEESKLMGYEAGADDYVTKPFSMAVLHAKMRALINRYHGDLIRNGQIRVNGIVIEVKRRTVFIGGKEAVMAPKEYDLLLYFVEHRNQVLTRQQILDALWGEEYFGYDRAVDTHVKKLRKALGEEAAAIETVIKSGYLFREEGRG